VFDVIDGKQRLESILMFTGHKRGRFRARTQLPGSESVEWVDWPLLKRKRLQHLVNSYDLPVVEVDGDIGEIIDLFVRINSTGKALTQQEKRHARYYNSPFLKEASRLADRFKGFLQQNRILSAGQLSRMKHVELMCELMLSLVQGDVLNKKAVLDRVMATTSFNEKDRHTATKIVTTTLNRIRRMFPHLKTTRLHQVTDFYSLVLVVGKFEQEGLILTDRHRNRLAWELLQVFATRVDEVRELQRRAKGARPDQELYRDYLLTVSQMTDDVSQRRKRGQILESILRSLFTSKDTQRGFSGEQRRILWNTSANRVCARPGCRKKLTWEDFTIDHINPHSKGGQSKLDNAALMCSAHNSAKGNRTK
jgi:hypothetical protein